MKLVLLRHGESTWNLENKFTGWTDVGLSENGIKEAHTGAAAIKAEGLSFDMAYTSVLKRAIKTLWITLEDIDQMWIPIERSWKLNERHYGALQGLNKAETAQKYGEEQTKIWRRSYDIRPPALEATDARYPGNQAMFASISKSDLPLTECLKDTVNRMLPYWEETIAPSIKAGKRVIIAAHGNSLRALVKHLDAISDNNIINLNIPTAVPLVYELDENLKPKKVAGRQTLTADTRCYPLGDLEAIAKAAEKVKNQTKA